MKLKIYPMLNGLLSFLFQEPEEIPEFAFIPEKMRDRLNLVLLAMRLRRFLGLEERKIPELICVPEGEVRANRLYAHFGRILVSRRWRQKSHIRYFTSTWTASELPPSDLDLEERTDIPWTESDEAGYLLAGENHNLRKVRVIGKPCGKCACNQLGLPCKCDFDTGTFTGYFKLVYKQKQYSDNPVL
jgi:hypothetical protein